MKRSLQLIGGRWHDVIKLNANRNHWNASRLSLALQDVRGSELACRLSRGESENGL